MSTQMHLQEKSMLQEAVCLAGRLNYQGHNMMLRVTLARVPTVIPMGYLLQGYLLLLPILSIVLVSHTVGTLPAVGITPLAICAAHEPKSRTSCNGACGAWDSWGMWGSC